MIWKKTAFGLAETKDHTLHIDPATRNLLLLIDGSKTEDMLLRHGIGVRPEQFRSLLSLGLIEAVDGGPKRPPPGAQPPASTRPAVSDGKPFAATLKQLISAHLGLAGFGLADAVQRAGSVVELQDIAQEVIALVRQRKGNVAAEEVAGRLFGRK